MENQTINKTRNGLYLILFRRLEEVRKKCHKDIIPFPLIFEKLCRNFSITKRECWEILFLLKEFGLIEIIKGHGIKTANEI